MPLPPRAKGGVSSSKRRSRKAAASCKPSGGGHEPRPEQSGFADAFLDTLAPFRSDEDPIYVNDADARAAPQPDRRRPPPPPPRSMSMEEEEDDDPAPHAGARRRAPECPPCPPCPPQQIIHHIEAPKPPPTDQRYDAFLYVFSGVLLLFLLEQFMQIGIHIGTRQMAQQTFAY